MEEGFNYKREWNDTEFVVAAVCAALNGFGLADHLGDVANDAIPLSATRSPNDLSSDYPKPPNMSAREVAVRYREIVTPILAELPCLAQWYDPEDGEAGDCASDWWELCPTCAARKRLKKQEQ